MPSTMIRESVSEAATQAQVTILCFTDVHRCLWFGSRCCCHWLFGVFLHISLITVMNYCCFSWLTPVHKWLLYCLCPVFNINLCPQVQNELSHSQLSGFNVDLSCFTTNAVFTCIQNNVECHNIMTVMKRSESVRHIKLYIQKDPIIYIFSLILEKVLFNNSPLQCEIMVKSWLILIRSVFIIHVWYITLSCIISL